MGEKGDGGGGNYLPALGDGEAIEDEVIEGLPESTLKWGSNSERTYPCRLHHRSREARQGT
ncbi:hypothetical protein RJ641_025738 [Dillenia turbinata]|uniref:Uncharacterized protein n=1 Tax=Dillenia turbinata TaxID=194707 RepID=A0AAN8WB32_9MAGN